VWPVDVESLITRQLELGEATAQPGRPSWPGIRIGACWVCSPHGLAGRGRTGDTTWTAAVVMTEDEVISQLVMAGVAGAAYLAGLLWMDMAVVTAGFVRVLGESSFLDPGCRAGGERAC
jgi:hypothetical protein